MITASGIAFGQDGAGSGPATIGRRQGGHVASGHEVSTLIGAGYGDGQSRGVSPRSKTSMMRIRDKRWRSMAAIRFDDAIGRCQQRRAAYPMSRELHPKVAVIALSLANRSRRPQRRGWLALGSVAIHSLPMTTNLRCRFRRHWLYLRANVQQTRWRRHAACEAAEVLRSKSTLTVSRVALELLGTNELSRHSMVMPLAGASLCQNVGETPPILRDPCGRYAFLVVCPSQELRKRVHLVVIFAIWKRQNFH